MLISGCNWCFGGGDEIKVVQFHKFLDFPIPILEAPPDTHRLAGYGWAATGEGRATTILHSLRTWSSAYEKTKTKTKTQTKTRARTKTQTQTDREGEQQPQYCTGVPLINEKTKTKTATGEGKVLPKQLHNCKQLSCSGGHMINWGEWGISYLKC